MAAQPRGRRRRSRKAKRSGKRTGKRFGDGAFLTGERQDLEFLPTEGANGAVGSNAERTANLSGKADSEGEPTVRTVVWWPSGVCMSAVVLKQTPLHGLHVELGAKMVAFAGYSMPVNYPDGIIAEHRHCRTSAALFDVSHMGQLQLLGDGAARALESLVPVDVVDLGVDKQRYALFTNSQGGILDDLMVTRRADDLLLIVNAACKEADTRHLMTSIGTRCTVVPMPERALLALQGPKAVHALSRLNPEVGKLVFMTGGAFRLAGSDCFVTRSGYTGEDGFEISVAGRRCGGARPRAAEGARGQAGRPGRARHAAPGSRACACTATTSTTTPRRSRPGSPGRSRKCAAPAARAPATTPARRRSKRSSPPVPRSSASAWSAWSACRCAKARCCSMPRTTSSAT